MLGPPNHHFEKPSKQRTEHEREGQRNHKNVRFNMDHDAKPPCGRVRCNSNPMLTMAYSWLIVFYSFAAPNPTMTSKLGTYDTHRECRAVAQAMQQVYPELDLQIWRCVRISSK